MLSLELFQHSQWIEQSELLQLIARKWRFVILFLPINLYDHNHVNWVYITTFVPIIESIFLFIWFHVILGFRNLRLRIFVFCFLIFVQDGCMFGVVKEIFYCALLFGCRLLSKPLNSLYIVLNSLIPLKGGGAFTLVKIYVN